MVIKEISPIDFLKRFLSYKKIIVIDIRSSSEYYQYHLKDSINIPINKLLNDYSYLLNKHTQYYLVCNDGRKSKYISKLLKDYDDIIVNTNTIIDTKGTNIILFNIVIKFILKKLFIKIGILAKKDINDVTNILIK